MEPIEAAGSLGTLRLENKEEWREDRQPKLHPESHYWDGLVTKPQIVSPPLDSPSELPKLPVGHLAASHLYRHCTSQGAVSDWPSVGQRAESGNIGPLATCTLRVPLRYPPAGQPVHKHLQHQVSGIRASTSTYSCFLGQLRGSFHLSPLRPSKMLTFLKLEILYLQIVYQNPLNTDYTPGVMLSADDRVACVPAQALPPQSHATAEGTLVALGEGKPTKR